MQHCASSFEQTTPSQNVELASACGIRPHETLQTSTILCDGFASLEEHEQDKKETEKKSSARESGRERERGGEGERVRREEDRLECFPLSAIHVYFL